MNKEERINQIVSEMHAGERETYVRNGENDELLNELFKLQEETVKMTFSDEHTDCGKLRLTDVWKHLNQLNMDRGHIADEEIDNFGKDSWDLKNAIDAIVSGNRGERETFRNLKMLHCNHRVLKNIALQVEDYRGELDAVVITERAVFLIEVKNTKTNILIDEKGTFFRISESGHLNTCDHDKNIGEKMNEKEYLLRKTLESNGFEDPKIHSLLVFTNINANIENRYKYIQHCFLSDMLPIIQNVAEPIRYSNNEMDRMAACLNAAAQDNSFPFPLDAASFKLHFATLMAKLEGFEGVSERSDQEVLGCEEEKLIGNAEEQQIAEQKEEKKKTAPQIGEQKKSVSGRSAKGAIIGTIGFAALMALGLTIGLKIKK